MPTHSPTLYTREQHQIDLDAIDGDALYVIERLQQAGHTAYLVGGGVRDLLLRQTPKDFDISTSARPDQVKKLFRRCLIIGRRFRLAHVHFGNKVIEVATFRAGDPETDRLIVQDNEWGTPEQDVLRRDFTLNGLFYEPESDVVLDYVGGFEDVQRRRLMTIGEPELRFRQDPVRMIRLLKFQARFDLEVEERTGKALASCVPEILKSAPARVLEELLRMLESGSAARFFDLIVEARLLEQLMPQLAEAFTSSAGRTMRRALQAVDALQRQTRRPRLPLPRAALFASLLWPLMEEMVAIEAGETGRPPSLGTLQEMSVCLVSEVFQKMPHFPRRLRWQIELALSDQFRLTPLNSKVGAHRLSGEQRELAIALLKIRAVQDAKLLPIYERVRQQGGAARKKPKGRL